MILTEALTLGLIGAVVGGVIGVALGRVAWTTGAREIGIGPDLPPIPALVATSVAVVLLLPLLLSIWPALRAARSSAAAGLRDE